MQRGQIHFSPQHPFCLQSETFSPLFLTIFFATCPKRPCFAKYCILACKTHGFGLQNAAYCNAKVPLSDCKMMHIANLWTKYRLALQIKSFWNASLTLYPAPRCYTPQDPIYPYFNTSIFPYYSKYFHISIFKFFNIILTLDVSAALSVPSVRRAPRSDGL